MDVIIEEATSQSNTAAVLSGRLDAVFIPGNPRLLGCEAKYLWDERIYVALSENHPSTEAREVAWNDIRDETFLVTADATGPEIEDYLVRQLSGPGFRPKISVQRVGRENLLNMAGKGFGITLTTDSTLGTAYQGVSFRPITGVEEIVSSSIVWCSTNGTRP